MKTIFLLGAVLVLCLATATGQGKTLTNDPLTGLPLISATDSGRRPDLGNLAYTYNQPTQMPGAQICKSKYQGNFYSLYNIKTNAAAAWYSSHLSGFKKVQGYGSGRAQIAFFNSDRTILVIVTGDTGAQGQDVNAYAVAYEKYQPGLSDKTVESLTQGKIVCK